MHTYTYHFQTQARQLGWGSKLLAALFAAVLLVGGLFFSLLMLVVGAALVGVTMLRLWWAGKKLQQGRGTTVNAHEGRVIDADYRVK